MTALLLRNFMLKSGIYRIWEGYTVLEFRKDVSFAEKHLFLGIVEAAYPRPSEWDEAAFDALKERELTVLFAEFRNYDRKAVFGENPYYRYFKKYKKTYPVLQQLESVLLKGRPFPSGRPLNEVAFLTELRTRVLSGAHDAERVQGAVELFCPEEKLPFTGMRGEEVHTYPSDPSARDNGGIIFSMIAGADERTCLRPESRHIFYPFFATPDTTREQLLSAMELLVSYVRVLAPSAQIESCLVE